MQAQLCFWQLNGSSSEALLGALSTLVGSGRRLLAELVAHLAEVEERRLHLDLGYGSMFAYCTGRLGFSEDEGYRRIEVSRLARQHPAIYPRLATGDLSLSVTVLLKPFIQHANADELLELVSRQTVARAKELLAARFPRPDAPSVIRKLPTRRANDAARIPSLTAPRTRTSSGFAGDGQFMETARITLDSPRPASAAPTPTKPLAPLRRNTRPIVEPLSEGRYRIQITADTHLKNKLELARDLMRHAQPDGDLAPILARALDLLIESVMQRRFGARRAQPRKGPRTASATSTDTPVTPSPSHPGTTQPHGEPNRTIPRASRRTVLERDGLQCAWCGPDGTRCTARAWLEHDHVQPWARGGSAAPENLRLLCRPHNRRAAEREYGQRHVAHSIARTRTGPRPTCAAIADHTGLTDAPHTATSRPIGETSATQSGAQAARVDERAGRIENLEPMRKRHIYAVTLGSVHPLEVPAPSGVALRSPEHTDRDGLARLMLDAYRGTIDYEGEEFEEARIEVQRHLDSAPLLDDSTIALAPSGELISACLLREWPRRQTVLVAFIMTVPSTIQRGLATACLTRSLALLAARGVPHVHSVITEGNTPSERLFAKVGFVRTP